MIWCAYTVHISYFIIEYQDGEGWSGWLEICSVSSIFVSSEFRLCTITFCAPTIISLAPMFVKGPWRFDSDLIRCIFGR